MIEELEALAEEQAAAEYALEQSEKSVKRCKKALADVSEKRFPEAMEALGLSKFETEAGLKITLTKKIRGSITEANRPAAMNWLREHGHNAMIKRSLTIIARDDDQGQELLDMLEEYDVADKAMIPWNTLDKFLTEMMEEGEDIPQETFGVYRQLKTKVKK